MKRALFTTMGLGLVALVVACGGGSAATPAPGSTPAPGATAAPASTPAPQTQAPPPPVAGNPCAGQPTFDPQSGVFPSAAPDVDLAAKFPTQIAGNPVTNLETSHYIQFVCAFGNAETIARAQQAFGNNLAAVTFGSADVTIADEDATVSAFRVAGVDANQVMQHIPELVAALGGDTSQQFTTAQANMGGKNITVMTDSDENVNFLYPSGDTIWSVSGDTSADVAGQIFAALP